MRKKCGVTHAKRLAVRRHEVLIVRVGDQVRLGARELVLRKVDVHLVAVKVGVVGVAVCIVKTQRALAGQHARNVRHHRRLVQRRLPVHEKNIAVAEVPKHALVHRAQLARAGLDLRRQQLARERHALLIGELAL